MNQPASNPVTITLPDGSTKSYDGPVTGAQIAADIGPGLAKAALALRIDGTQWDLARAIDQDAAIEIITRKDDDGFVLDDHEGAEPDFPPRVFFNEFNRDSLNVRIIYWYHPPNYWDFMAYSQQLNTQIMRKFTAAGIRFALPAATTYMSQGDDGPLQLNVLNDPGREEST